ncbi:MAG: hypothetical protein GDA40_06095 [Rhodobacteraceae bacterium]|nr:hypothetical protein [Paracoccaceae bacterium]
MLISHKYKFIFIKTHKTAGTSIQYELARIMADDDIYVPPIAPRSSLSKFIERFRIYKIESWLLSDDRWRMHMAARHVKKHIGAETFDRYFKFCVEREPVDKCISKYWWLKRNPNYIERLLRVNMSWDRFIGKPKRLPIDVDLWTGEAGHLMVDHILRYENLNEEIRQVGRELGFRIEGVKEQYKTDIRRPGIKVSEEQREMIYQAFAESNHHTGYKIEDYKLT